MSMGKSVSVLKHFLEDYPECAEAFRYLLKCPEKRTVLMDLCSRFKISSGTWMKCYARFGPRNGLRWIETVKRDSMTVLVCVVPEHATQLNELVNGGEKNGTK